jgi:DNA polymerase-3 subunit alpha
LVKCGAFDSFKIKRGELAGNIEELLRFNQAAKKIAESNQYNLFGVSTLKSSLCLKPAGEVPARVLLAWEKELLGLYVSDHPFNSYAEKARKLSRPISEVYEHQNGSEIQNLRLSGVITVIQKITTKKGDPMLFATIEDDTGKIEILVFSRMLAKSGAIWQNGKAILLSGKLSWRDEEPKIICEEAREL